MIEIPTFESYVVKGIMGNNEFGIRSINHLESIKSMNLERENYPNIVQLIRKKDYDSIRELPAGVKDFEYLEIMKFKDQDNMEYIVTVYSGDELSQDPQIIDVFQLK